MTLLYHKVIVTVVTGNYVQAVKHSCTIQQDIRVAQSMTNAELYRYAKKLGTAEEDKGVGTSSCCKLCYR